MLCVPAVLRLGRADLLSPPAPKSTHLQLIKGRFSPPGISFKSRVHSSAPRNFVLSLKCGIVGSFRHVSPGWCGSCFSPSVAVHLALCVLSIHLLFSATATSSDPELFSTLNLQPRFVFQCLHSPGPGTSLAEQQHATCLLWDHHSTCLISHDLEAPIRACSVGLFSAVLGKPLAFKTEKL